MHRVASKCHDEKPSCSKRAKLVKKIRQQEKQIKIKTQNSNTMVNVVFTSVLPSNVHCLVKGQPGLRTLMGQRVARPAPVPPHSSHLASIMANFQSVWQAGTGLGLVSS